MKKFISCDWGTSALRLRVVDLATAKVLAEVSSDDGIATVFHLWQECKKVELDRIPFYLDVLGKKIYRLEQELGTSLDEVAVVISGMASSSIGMDELLYKEIPIDIRKPELNWKKFESLSGFNHAVYLVSGVRSANDVMRGEETQLIGCIDDENVHNGLFIFPGTHSKHVFVKDGSVTGLRTYMTGEIFDLLSTKSVLSSSIMRPAVLTSELKNRFTEGIVDGRQGNLLHHAFMVRTNDLFKKMSKEENYYYLSGLVIGTELNSILNDPGDIVLVASGEPGKLYAIALKSLERDIKVVDPGTAVVMGQMKIFGSLLL
jgi:2-dehydro-3-deoxygalactonokinase